MKSEDVPTQSGHGESGVYSLDISFVVVVFCCFLGGAGGGGGVPLPLLLVEKYSGFPLKLIVKIFLNDEIQ